MEAQRNISFLVELKFHFNRLDLTLHLFCAFHTYCTFVHFVFAFRTYKWSSFIVADNTSNKCLEVSIFVMWCRSYIIYFFICFQLLGAVNRSTCPIGQVIAKRGAKSELDCEQCPAGYICTEDNLLPVPCTPGMYKNLFQTFVISL